MVLESEARSRNSGAESVSVALREELQGSRIRLQNTQEELARLRLQYERDNAQLERLRADRSVRDDVKIQLDAEIHRLKAENASLHQDSGRWQKAAVRAAEVAERAKQEVKSLRSAQRRDQDYREASTLSQETELASVRRLLAQTQEHLDEQQDQLDCQERGLRAAQAKTAQLQDCLAAACHGKSMAEARYDDQCTLVETLRATNDALSEQLKVMKTKEHRASVRWNSCRCQERCQCQKTGKSTGLEEMNDVRDPCASAYASGASEAQMNSLRRQNMELRRVLDSNSNELSATRAEVCMLRSKIAGLEQENSRLEGRMRAL